MIEQFVENFLKRSLLPGAASEAQTLCETLCLSVSVVGLKVSSAQTTGSQTPVENQEKSLRRVPSAKARGRVPFEKRMLAGLWRRKLTLVLIIGCCDNSFRVADENWHYSDALSTQPFEPVRFAFSQSSSHSSKLKLSSGFVAVASIA